MTGREKLEAEEQKRHMITLYPRCAVCGIGPSTQLAHRMSQSKANLRKYGKKKVHHHFNLVPVCGLKCNSAVLIDGNPMLRQVMVTAMTLDLDGETEAGLRILKPYDFAAPHVFGLRRQM